MGEVFAGRFELLEPVAEGGMGSVWVVRDRRDGASYAGKVLRQSDAASLLRFMREQATRIEHPHVVTPLSWAGEDDRVLFTMRLVRGGSVATLLGDHGPLPASWVVEILRQALDGLAAVHAAGVVHRDLKPANLLLEASGTGRPHVRITDFGIAVPLGEPRLTRASQLFGSPGYMAPEQLAGADPDPRQDLFALATCGMEMLTGVRPPAAAAALAALVADDDRFAPLARVLERGCALDPGARPDSASRLADELGGLPLPPDPPGEPPEVLEQVGDRHPLPPPAPVPARQPSMGSRRGAGVERTAGLALVAIGLVAALAALALVLTR